MVVEPEAGLGERDAHAGLDLRLDGQLGDGTRGGGELLPAAQQPQRSLDGLDQCGGLGGETGGGGPLHQRHAQRQVGVAGDSVGQQPAERGPALRRRFAQFGAVGGVLPQ